MMMTTKMMMIAVVSNYERYSGDGSETLPE